MVWGAPNPNTLPFELEDTGSNFGGSLDGGWKTFQGSSIPENTGKIQREMGEKLGAQFWGFSYAILNEEDARR